MLEQLVNGESLVLGRMCSSNWASSYRAEDGGNSTGVAEMIRANKRQSL
jgi:hypothetical protein